MKPRWHIKECIKKTVEFSKTYIENPDRLPEEMDREIETFFTSICSAQI